MEVQEVEVVEEEVEALEAEEEASGLEVGQENQVFARDVSRHQIRSGAAPQPSREGLDAAVAAAGVLLFAQQLGYD